MSLIQAAKEIILGNKQNREELNKLRQAAENSAPGELFYINTNEKPNSSARSPIANQLTEQKLSQITL